MHDIAIIDFENLFLKEEYDELELTKWKEIGDKVYKATSEYGFFYIKNHGIDRKYIDKQFDIAKKYFELSDTEKTPYGIQTDNYGYCGLDQEALDETTNPDPKELFNVMTSTGPIPKERTPPYFQENNDKIKEFYRQCHQLSVKILRSFAFGLKLKDYKFFDNSNKIEEKSGTTLRYLHYPPIPNANEELLNKKIIRAGAHSDYGSLTLLFQADCDGLDSEFSGLQVRHGKNNWLNVGNKEGCIVVNTGDLMSIWTEGRMKSAVHRVLVPNAEVAKVHRYSIAFFSNSNSDYPIYPLDSPIETPKPAKKVSNSKTGKLEHHSVVGVAPFVYGENDYIYRNRRLLATTTYKPLDTK